MAQLLARSAPGSPSCSSGSSASSSTSVPTGRLGRAALEPELIAYAAADTAFLLPSRTAAERLETSPWGWAVEDCARLATVRHEETAPGRSTSSGSRAPARSRPGRDRCTSSTAGATRRPAASTCAIQGARQRPLLELAGSRRPTRPSWPAFGLGPRFTRGGGRGAAPLHHPGLRRSASTVCTPAPIRRERRRLQRLVEVRDGSRPASACRRLVCRARLQAIAAARRRAPRYAASLVAPRTARCELRDGSRGAVVSCPTAARILASIATSRPSRNQGSDLVVCNLQSAFTGAAVALNNDGLR